MYMHEFKKYVAAVQSPIISDLSNSAISHFQPLQNYPNRTSLSPTTRRFRIVVGIPEKKMKTRINIPVRSVVARNRSFRYLPIAVIAASLFFTAARAQQNSSDDATFRKLIDDYCAAWSTGTTDAPAKFYAKDSDLVFYDVTPFSYHGWSEYVPGVHKALLDQAASASLTAGKDLKVTRRGNIAWTTVPMHFVEKTKDGKTVEADLRYTGIWEKRGDQWLLVHEHISAPLGSS
jgi:ketosteroid isomerase-like protein